MTLDHYKLLGRSGLRVSPMSLGTMTFGSAWGWGADGDEARRIFDLYVDRGGNFIDTAVNYTDGGAERLLGTFIGYKRERIVLATKFTMARDPGNPNSGGNHRFNMIRSRRAEPRATPYRPRRPPLSPYMGHDHPDWEGPLSRHLQHARMADCTIADACRHARVVAVRGAADRVQPCGEDRGARASPGGRSSWPWGSSMIAARRRRSHRQIFPCRCGGLARGDRVCQPKGCHSVLRPSEPTCDRDRGRDSSRR